MPRIMGDNDIPGQFAIFLRLLNSPAWKAFWESLEIAVETFESLGLERTARDDLLWQTCQDRQVVLITGNRNQESSDSLEATIRAQNQADSLPVITLSDTRRFVRDRVYAERVVVKLLEYLMDIDRYRGTGRLYVP